MHPQELTIRIAQVGWIILTIITAGLLLISIPVFLDYLSNYGNNPTVLPDLQALGLTPTFYHIWGLFINFVPALLFLLGGVIIVGRKPHDQMVLLTGTFLVGLVNIFPSISIMGTQQFVLGITVALLNSISILCLIVFCYTFPTGKFVFAWMQNIGVAVALIGLLSLPILWQAAPSLFAPAAIIWTAIILFSIVYAQRRRWQEATPMQRQQMRWVMFGLTVTIANLCGFVAISALLQLLSVPDSVVLLYNLIYGTIACVGMALIPLTIGFSVLRYRLWEIDVLISQTLVYSVLTGILTVAYVASVLIIQEIALTLTGIPQSSWAIALSTLVIAGLFQPIRRALQHRIAARFSPSENDSLPAPALEVAFASAPVMPPPPSPPLEDPLSPRETEVLRLIAEGSSNQQIAEKLYITEGTVKRHTTNLYGKLGVRSRTQAVARGRELGLIP